jgi:acyl-CoA synthetase (NDP forming)
MAEERTAADLATLFRARSVALVGATEKSVWCQILMQGLRANAYPGRVHLVNPRGGEVFGQSALASCRSIDTPVDLAVVMVPAAALGQALDDVGAAGIRFAVVLTSGFAELGGAGAVAQDGLVARARAAELTLLGPNSLGFVNYVDNVPAMVLPPQLPRLSGPVAVVSQSGATAGAVAAYAYQQGVGLSYLVSLGNEAMVGLADVLDYLVEDGNTRAIALFAETIRDVPRFVESAGRALSAGKPIVILKIGTSELTAQVAQAHTGALVGDDKVFDAACRQLGLVRVHCIEEMVTTASLLAFTGVIRKRGLGIVSISGGACEMIADTAQQRGVTLPQFAPSTLEPLRAVLSDIGASTHNPLDITGAAIGRPEMFEQVLGIVGRDARIGLTAAIYGMPNEPARAVPHTARTLTHIANGIKASGTPGLLLTQTIQPLTDVSRAVMAESGIQFLMGGLRDGIRAIGHAFAWSQRQEREPYRPLSTVAAPAAVNTSAVDAATNAVTNKTLGRPRTERGALDYLASHGVPVIPAVTAVTEEQAVNAARAAQGPVVMKIASPDIAHKTEVGGVLLNLHSDSAVAAGYQRILANVKRAQPHARVDGVIVSPLRVDGTELFVGLARDPQWGLVLAVALGGVWVEALEDSSLRVLPVDELEIEAMFRELRAARILDGFRGQPRIDACAVAQTVARIAAAAVALGPDLISLEVNPLFVGADGRIECLDALAIWADPER